MMSLSSVKVVLIPGLLGIGRRESFREIPLRQESLDLALSRNNEGYIRGVAIEEESKVIAMEFGKPGSLKTHLGVGWNFSGEPRVVHFAKCYLSHTSSWQLAKLVQKLQEIFPGETRGHVRVYNVEPLILGGAWKDKSEVAAWVRFLPFLNQPVKTGTMKSESVNEITTEVLEHLRAAAVSEQFIEELIALRAKRIDGLSGDVFRRKGA